MLWLESLWLAVKHRENVRLGKAGNIILDKLKLGIFTITCVVIATALLLEIEMYF